MVMKRSTILTRFAEFVLLASAIAIYLLFFFQRGEYTQPMILRAAERAQSFNEFYSSLDYAGFPSYSLLYAWLFSKIPLVLPALQVALMLVLYVVARKVSGSGIVGSLSALIYAVAPGTLTLYALDPSGFLLALPVILLSILLLLYGGLVSTSNVALVAGFTLYLFTLLHPGGSLPLLVFTTITLLGYLEGRQMHRELKVLLLMVIAVVVVVVYFKPANYDIYTVPSIVVATCTLLVHYVVKASRVLTASERTVVVVQTALLALLSGILVYVTGDYKALSPITPSIAIMYGASGLFALFGFLTVMLSESSHVERCIVALAFTLTSLSAVSYAAFPVALVSLVLASSLFLGRVARVLVSNTTALGRVGVSTAILVLLALIIALVPGSYVVSASFVEKPMVFREAVDLSKNKGFQGIGVEVVEALGEELADAVRLSSTSNTVLVVAYWDYSYWVHGILASKGVRAITLSHTLGDEQSKSLVSRIMVSDWETSRALLKHISLEKGVNDTYVLVTFAYSVDYTNDSFIGVPYTIYGATSQRPILLYEGYGDLAYTPLYLRLANKTLGDYIYQLLGNERAQSLLWTSQGREILISQLCVKALHDAGYSAVYNYMIESRPLDPSISGFKLIYSRSIPLGRISVAYYGDYNVYYMIALFKLE